MAGSSAAKTEFCTSDPTFQGWFNPNFRLHAVDVAADIGGLPVCIIPVVCIATCPPGNCCIPQLMVNLGDGWPWPQFDLQSEVDSATFQTAKQGVSDQQIQDAAGPDVPGGGIAGHELLDGVGHQHVQDVASQGVGAQRPHQA